MFSYTLLVRERIHPNTQNGQQIRCCAFGAIVAVLVVMRRCRRRRNCSEWTRECARHRPRFRVYHGLVQELRFGHEARCRHFLRMDAATFDELLAMVGPWRWRHPLIFRTTSRMKLKVVLFCATCCVRLVTVRLFNIHGATFVVQQSHTAKVAPFMLALSKLYRMPKQECC